ncbi:hypothetical protein MRBLWH7_000338 [Microbacterium sp. LWH7-1.2]|uniref:hypothetical protein n=1 Tax=Microbacterium sp. LWH7-1.2 TaxID=3135257 RepID=UPI003138DD3F
MGTSKRYAAHFDRLGEEGHLARLAETGGLQSLSARELALDRLPLTIDPEPKPVLAWVRFFGEAVRVRAWACRWTSRAVGVKFTAGGKEYTTWVWSDAVDLDPEVRPPSDDQKYRPT